MKIINIEKDTKILKNVSIGRNVKISNFVNCYGCSIGDGTKIGAFVEIQKGARIGKNCKISSHTFICEGVDIGDDVFVGHNVTFINDKYPKAVKADGSLMTDADWKVIKTKVKKGVSIGSSATILCGVTVGEKALIGAGAVVTKNIPPHAIVVGNPGKITRSIKK